MLFTKEANGRTRWFAIYSNNYRDDDGKPEIISARSHKAYSYLVKEKLVALPELWHWHVPGTRWGQADYVDFVEMKRGLFTIATGLVDEGHEKEADILSGMDVLVSHGMPKSTLMYEASDSTIISFHVTREISPLPFSRAANKHTGFMVFKETDTMKKGLRPEQSAHLKGLGYTDEQLSQIENLLQTKDTAAEEEGRENKEATNASDGGSVENDNPPTEQTTNDANALFAMWSKEIAEGMGAVMAPLLERLDAIDARLAAQEAAVKEISTQAEAQAEKTVAATPAMSVKELLMQAVYSSPTAQVDGRSALAKETPKEKQATPAGATGIPVLDALIVANRQ